MERFEKSSVFLFLACALGPPGCVGIEFRTDPDAEGNEEALNENATDPSSGGHAAETPTSLGSSSGDGGYAGKDGSGGGNHDAQGTGAQGAREPNDSSPLPGIRQGPTLEQIDFTMGGYNSDLPLPAPCPDLPSTICVTFTGLINDQPISGSCDPNSANQENNIFRCTGPGFSFLLENSGYMGIPPQDFALIASPRQFALGFSWDEPQFNSHEEGQYVIESTHEQQSMRAFGINYELQYEDDSTTHFVQAAWGVRWLSRTTCATCPSLRLLGRFGARVEK